MNVKRRHPLSGSRCFIRGLSVNAVKRHLKQMKVQFKRVRHSGYADIVEVIYTQYNRYRDCPIGAFQHHPVADVVYKPFEYSRDPKKRAKFMRRFDV